MSGRHQPLNGADSDYTLFPFRVQLRDTEGPSWWTTVYAHGRHDARNQAIQKAYDAGADAVGVIRIEPVTDEAEQVAAEDSEEARWKDDVPAEATFDEWKRWAGIR